MVNILVSNRFDIYCYSLQLSKEKHQEKKREIKEQLPESEVFSKNQAHTTSAHALRFT